MDSNQKTARKAGILYLLVILFGGFAYLYVRTQLINYDDIEATVNNIINNELLYRFGFVADLIQLTCFSFLLLTLYKLLRTVNEKYARAMFLIAIIGVPIACLNMLNQYAILVLLDNTNYAEAFEIGQINALSVLFLEFHNLGYAIAHIFFGLWLFPLGYLVYKSNLFPKIIGVLLMIAAFGYLTHVLTGFLYSKGENISQYGALFSGMAELFFCLWLLIARVKPLKR